MGDALMRAINAVANVAVEGEIAILSINSPPVNALSQQVREGIVRGMQEAIDNSADKAVVLICEGKTFMAGADITEFGKPPRAPSIVEAEDAIENSPKPVIAAIHGTVLGGGLEVALCCHYRVAVPSAKCGLPEVNLGLLPGAGGTQRLPRIVGVEQALDMVTSESTCRHPPRTKPASSVNRTGRHCARARSDSRRRYSRASTKESARLERQSSPHAGR
jgi:3-hydroxyacyl-CoA dehydrogenase